MLHQEAKHDLVLPFQTQLVFNDWTTCDFNAISRHEEVGRLLAMLDILMVPQVFEEELLVVVRFLLVHIEIGTVKVEQAVGELVARERSYDQLGLISIEHATARKVTLGDTRLLNQLLLRRLFTLPALLGGLIRGSDPVVI